MKTRAIPAVLLSAALLAAAGSAVSAAEKPDAATLITMKRVSDRYALTKARIATLLDLRLHPVPLPNNLPNPFYRSPDLPDAPAATGPVETTVVPAEADVTDADTLAHFAATLKINGAVSRNGQPHLIINQALCKAGDIIPVERKSGTIYIQVVNITADELTLGLNDERQVVKLKH